MVNPAAPGYAYQLSSVIKNRLILRVRCYLCKRTHYYRPEDLVQLFGDADVNALHHKIKCEKCNRTDYMQVEVFAPTGSDAARLKIRRLVAIKLVRVPIWREE